MNKPEPYEQIERNGSIDPDERREEALRSIGTIGEDDSLAMPRALRLAVARNMHAMEDYARLSERERAAFLSLARMTDDGEEMDRLLRSLHP